MIHLEIHPHNDFWLYLQQNYVNRNNQTFSFLDKSHFIELTSAFLPEYLIQTEVEKMISSDVISSEDEQLVRSNIPASFIEETSNYIETKLFPHSSHMPLTFSLTKFINLHLSDIKTNIRSMLYESLTYLSESKNEIVLGEAKEDVLYMILSPNGSCSLAKKDCTHLSKYSYHQQEFSVAEAFFYNPSTLIVYDYLHLLKPELVLCLKKTLRKKVVFLEEKFPLHIN